MPSVASRCKPLGGRARATPRSRHVRRHSRAFFEMTTVASVPWLLGACAPNL